MPKTRAANAASVLTVEARKEVRRRDAALREEMGENPAEDAVVAAFARYFPASHMNDRQIRQYARSVAAGRPHFV